jgi:hypothetical protein
MKRMKAKAGEDLQLALLRRLSGVERVRLGCELYEIARQVAAAGIQKQHPYLSPAEVQEKVKERFAAWSKSKRSFPFCKS